MYSIPLVGGPANGKIVYTKDYLIKVPVFEISRLLKTEPQDTCSAALYKYENVKIEWTNGKFECWALVYEGISKEQLHKAIIAMFLANILTVGVV